MAAKRTEASIQRAVVGYAREHGVVAIKLSTNGRFGTSGWPDYLLIPAYPGVPFMIEFKSQGGKLSALQKQRIDELSGRLTVYVVDDVEDGKRIVGQYL